MPNFVSFTASGAELAHGEKSHTQSIAHPLTHPVYLMCREWKFLLPKNFQLQKIAGYLSHFSRVLSLDRAVLVLFYMTYGVVSEY